MNAQTNATLKTIADALHRAERVMLTTHAKPDGDALGSVVAMATALKRLGKAVECRVIPPVPGNLEFLASRIELIEHDDGTAMPRAEPDAILVLDTGAWSQLEKLRPYLEPRHDAVIVVDHHLHGDDVGALRYVDDRAAAACEIVVALLDELGVAIDAAMAEALYAGIATDCGWFRFSNTSERTHEIAARLHRAGVDNAELYRRTDQGERPEKLALMARALDGTRLIAGGRAAVMTLRLDDFTQTGGRDDETERFVDLPQMVREVEVVAMVVEQNGRCRLSFRSKPGPNAVDVNELARGFGGGGHARAAGAKVQGAVDETVDRVVGAIEAALAARVT